MNTLEPNDADQSSSLRAYAELVRLPNLFTAMADVTMGFLFTRGLVLEQEDYWVCGLLVAASTALYAAGVVLNDVFDVEVDRRERPERPIPSGRVSLGAAMVCPAIVGLLLAGCIVLYDGYLKRLPFGPIGMGVCRALNVLLGMSVLLGPWQAAHWLVAGALGVYIAGVTWFARSEAGQSRSGQLAAAMLVILAGVGLLTPVPQLVDQPVWILMVDPQRWYLLIGALAVLTGLRCLRAVMSPEPDRVQMAVTGCIQTVIILDASVAFVVTDVTGAIYVMLFLLPTVIFGRRVYST
jgi:UbiA prenyltransferase family